MIRRLLHRVFCFDNGLIPWGQIGALTLAAALVMTLSGCSTMPAEVQAHEERHCEGWDHTGQSPFYVWTKARPASIKPWLYVYAVDVDRACREYAGATSTDGHRINGCAQWKPVNCLIILPDGAP